jgi:beta-lactamase regulating signal transducer with metallopeptidase domain
MVTPTLADLGASAVALAETVGRTGLTISLWITVMGLGVALLAAWLPRASAAIRHALWMVLLLGGILLPLSRGVLSPLQVEIPPSAAILEKLAVASSPVPAHQGSDPSIAGRTSTQKSQAAVGMVWIAGTLLGFLALVRDRRASSRILARSTPFPDPSWQRDVQFFRRHLQLTAGVSLKSSAEIDVPFTMGILHATMILPAGAGEWSRARRQAVLVHELGHIRRRDPLLQLAASVAQAIHWWNPVIRIAAFRAEIEAERAADEIALSLGLKASEYAGALVSFLSTRPVPSMAFARPSTLKERIHAILDPHTRPAPAPRRIVSTVTCALAGLCLIGTVQPNVAALFPAPVEQPLAEPAVVPAPAQADTDSPRAIRRTAKLAPSLPIPPSTDSTDVDVVGALVGALSDSSAHVRAAALRALADIGDPRALENVTARLTDSDPFVRSEAQRTRADLLQP